MFSSEYSEGDCVIHIADEKYRLYNPTGYAGVIIYRGWMLTIDEYKRLYDWPCIIPRELINSNYIDDDVWVQESKGHVDLVLKLEPTPASYAYMEHILSKS
jgi:hypothetical protein